MLIGTFGANFGGRPRDRWHGGLPLPQRRKLLDGPSTGCRSPLELGGINGKLPVSDLGLVSFAGPARDARLILGVAWS